MERFFWGQRPARQTGRRGLSRAWNGRGTSIVEGSGLRQAPGCPPPTYGGQCGKACVDGSTPVIRQIPQRGAKKTGAVQEAGRGGEESALTREARAGELRRACSAAVLGSAHLQEAAVRGRFLKKGSAREGACCGCCFELSAVGKGAAVNVGRRRKNGTDRARPAHQTGGFLCQRCGRAAPAAICLSACCVCALRGAAAARTADLVEAERQHALVPPRRNGQRGR
jgi:hypothetical protein